MCPVSGFAPPSKNVSNQVRCALQALANGDGTPLTNGNVHSHPLTSAPASRSESLTGVIPTKAEIAALEHKAHIVVRGGVQGWHLQLLSGTAGASCPVSVQLLLAATTQQRAAPAWMLPAPEGLARVWPPWCMLPGTPARKAL